MKQRTSYFLDVLLLSIIILPLFLLYLGNMPLHTPDEARYSFISVEMFNHHNYLVPKLLGVAFLDKPPLFYYSQLLMLKLFGNSEFVLRLPSVLSAVSACLMVYITTRKLFDRITACYATVILANMPLFFLMAHYANLDMMVASLITCCLCFYILSQQSAMATRKLMWCAYICMAAAMLTKGLIAVAFPCCIIFIYSLSYKIKPKLYLIDGVLIFAALVLPWFMMMHFEVKDFSYYYFVIQHFYRYLGKSFNNQQPFWFYWAIVVACSLPWLSFINRQFLEKAQAHFFSIAFIFIVSFFSIPASKPLGYILPAFPPLAVLLALQLRYTPTKKQLKIFFILSSLSLIVGCALLYPWPIMQKLALSPMPFSLILISSAVLIYLVQYIFRIQPLTKQNCCFAISILAMMLLNIQALKLIQNLEFQNIQPIANYLEQHNQQQKAPVAMYLNYYYDLSYYAPNQKLLIIDNWQKGLYKGDSLTEQFALGMQYHMPANYLTPVEFLKKWRNRQQLIYAISNQQQAKQLIKKNGGALIMQHRGIYLIKNIPSIQ